MTLEELEKRLRVLEDIEEIRQLQYTYIDSVMRCDWDGVDDCFLDDSVVDFKESGMLNGKKEISRDFRERISRLHIGKEGILTVHPRISVEEDTAKANWYFYWLSYHPREFIDYPDLDKAPEWVQGIYNMEYRRVDGKWKISLLKWRARLESMSKYAKQD